MEGERNTKYFHAVASRRKSKNLFTCLQENQWNWISDASDLSNQIANHFREIYVGLDHSSLENLITHLSSVNLPLLSEVDTVSLMIPFSMEELKEAVFGLPGGSASGPDGFHAKFYQTHWNLVQKDLFEVVQFFWHSEHLLKEINRTNIALIPKIDSPQVTKTFGL